MRIVGLLAFIAVLLIFFSMFFVGSFLKRQPPLESGCPADEHQDWETGKAISCETSPNRKFIGKFIFNGLSNPERYYELFVVVFDENKEQRVFAGDFRTSGWEWTEDNKIKIIYNCGTGCRATKTIGVDESISVSDYEDGGMNKKNGWEVEHFPSIPI